MRGKSRRGFTLIEIMIVVVIIGMTAAAVLPRVSFFREPPLTLLQRSIDDALNRALSGVSVRFVMKTEESSQRGKIISEALVKKEPDINSLSAFLGTENPDAEVLEWQPMELSYPLEGEGWRMEPDIVYFFTDGSCTPARISWVAPRENERDAEEFFLTVTGYCAPFPSSK